MHSIATRPPKKTATQATLRHILALLLAVLLLWGANPGPVQAAGEVTVTYIHTDISGNPIAATDEDGNLVWKESYQPFGARTQYNPASAAQTQWFHGKEQDAANGLQYFGARWYDPKIGRFLGIDPVGFQADNLHSFNRYAYGNNNPLRYVDPDGNNATAALGGLLTEGYNFATGQGFNGGMVWGALLDGYNGEGAGFWRSAGADLLNFGAVAAAGLIGRGAMAVSSRGSAALTTAQEDALVRGINVLGQGTKNCLNCVVATDFTLGTGQLAKALPSGVKNAAQLEVLYGTRFGAPSSIGGITQEMLSAGSGARGIVFAGRASRPGHLFNVVNRNGSIRYLDGQTGRAVTFAKQGYVNFRLLRTTL